MDKVRVGIAGFGNMGSGHAKKIFAGMVPEMELCAIADLKESRRAAAKELYPDVAIYEDASDMLKNADIDAAIIAVPHYDHPRLVMEAIENGLHAMCEKPAGVYVKQAREMIEFAAKHDRVFGMMFNQRTNCVFRKMKEMVDGGELGEIKRVNWIITDWYRTQYYYDSGEWRATWSGEGGGVLLNQCPHQLDLLQWICGLPVKVRAFLQMGKWHDIEVEDDVTAYLEFPNGATGVFVTSTGDAPGTNRFEITGTRGKLVCENAKTLTFSKLAEDEREFCKRSKESFKKPEMEVIEVETDGVNEQHVGVLKAFAGKILHGTPLVAEGAEGINGLQLSNAMHLSSWLDKTVELPVDEDLYFEELSKRIKTSRRKVATDAVSDTEGSY